jgi:hypothetical protein
VTQLGTGLASSSFGWKGRVLLPPRRLSRLQRLLTGESVLGIAVRHPVTFRCLLQTVQGDRRADQFGTALPVGDRRADQFGAGMCILGRADQAVTLVHRERRHTGRAAGPPLPQPSEQLREVHDVVRLVPWNWRPEDVGRLDGRPSRPWTNVQMTLLASEVEWVAVLRAQVQVSYTVGLAGVADDLALPNDPWVGCGPYVC